MDLDLIGRNERLFEEDIASREGETKELVRKSSFLVIGGAGSIGKEVCKQIFARDPIKLHVVDISENNMVELVRELRSSQGYIEGEFKTFAIDCGGAEFPAMLSSEGPYDYVFNLSALKHVRSEKDPFTLMRMLEVNIFNTLKTLSLTKKHGTKKYFCVSTDKAANPVNLMGSSKRIMEMFLMRESKFQNISMSRFANVAFSDGSLLHGFKQRFSNGQPISAPKDIKRYFVSPEESGELCLLSGLYGENRDIFFPKLSDNLHLVGFVDIAHKFLESLGYEVYECQSEDEARAGAKSLISNGKWPCYFFDSDTTGEKDFEEFYTSKETLKLELFKNIGVIVNGLDFVSEELDSFYSAIHSMRERGSWSKVEILREFVTLLPEFDHQEMNKYLDSRM